MKLAVIGGGSTYTPELADGIGRLLPGVEELVLVDPDPGRLAADGADAILFQLRIGGQAARQRDETWPLDCGCVGQETTGAGGWPRRSAPCPLSLIWPNGPSGGLRPQPSSSTSPTRWGSSPGPCFPRATARSACATWPSGSSGISPPCSASHPTGYPSATSA